MLFHFDLGAQFHLDANTHINHTSCEKFTLSNECYVYVCVRCAVFKLYVTKIDWNWFSRSTIRKNHSFRIHHKIIHSFIQLWYISCYFVYLFVFILFALSSSLSNACENQNIFHFCFHFTLANGFEIQYLIDCINIKHTLTFNPVHSLMSSSCFECWSSGSLSVSCKVSVPLSFSPSSIVRNDTESVTSCGALCNCWFTIRSSTLSDFWRSNEPNFSKKPPSIAWILEFWKMNNKNYSDECSICF